MYGDNRGSRDGGFRRQSNFVPVNVGEEIDVKIEAVGEKGDGVAKVKGFVLFVPNVKEGETVRIRVTKVLRKVGFAEVVGPATGVPAASSKAPEKKAEKEDEALFAGEDSEDFGDEE
jgi:predicted RNA-binding protein with TRAM domain